MSRVTLTEFMQARIAEAEAAARAADPAVWVSSLAFRVARVERSGAEAAHIALHSPARVLAECEAKRRIVEEYADILKWDTDEGDDHGIHGQRLGLEFAVKVAATVHADHPDYCEEWKP